MVIFCTHNVDGILSLEQNQDKEQKNQTMHHARSKEKAHDKLQQYVSDAVAANNAIIADAFNDGVVRIIDFLQRNNNNTNMQVVLDSGTLVGELAPALDSKLGNMVNKRNRGN